MYNTRSKLIRFRAHGQKAELHVAPLNPSVPSLRGEGPVSDRDLRELRGLGCLEMHSKLFITTPSDTKHNLDLCTIS